MVWADISVCLSKLAVGNDALDAGASSNSRYFCLNKNKIKIKKNEGNACVAD